MTDNLTSSRPSVICMVVGLWLVAGLTGCSLRAAPSGPLVRPAEDRPELWIFDRESPLLSAEIRRGPDHRVICVESEPPGAVQIVRVRAKEAEAGYIQLKLLLWGGGVLHLRRIDGVVYVWHAQCDLYEADKLFVEWYGGLTSFSRPISWDMPEKIVFRQADVMAEIDRRREQGKRKGPEQ